MTLNEPLYALLRRFVFCKSEPIPVLRFSVIIVIFLFLNLGNFCSILEAQVVSVIDKSTSEPLINVIIHSKDSSISIKTNAKGKADLSKFRVGDSLVFYQLGYISRIINYKELATLNYKVILAEKPFSFDEIVISASRFGEKRKDIPQQVQILKSRDLQFMNQQTTADVMTQSGNILVQKSQLGGGSPIIRGFEANKVLMVLDGVRLNNAIYRGGHLQNILTMDNSIMEKVEVIFGPGSVIYGSDALGGVMSFYTRNPILSGSDSLINTSANYLARFSTASMEKTGHVDFNLGGKNLGFLTSISFSDFDYLRQGNNRNPDHGNWGKRFFYVERINGRDSIIKNKNPNIQRPSGYHQYDFLEKILYKKNDKRTHIINFQFSNSGNIPRYDRLNELSLGKPKFSDWYYGPQKRLFGSYSFNYIDSTRFFDQVRFILAYQNIEESRHDRRFNNLELNSRIENLDIINFNGDYEKRIKNHEIRYGMDYSFNFVNSKANSKNIETGIRSPLDTRYPDGGSSMENIGFYLTEGLELSQKLIFNGGIRYNFVSIHAKYKDTTFFAFPYKETNLKNDALNGNLGMVFMPGDGWRFSLIGSSGFRAPNIDDLSKIFESVPGNLIVPNPNLKPEITYNSDLTIGKELAEQVHVEGVGFYTYYKNAITMQPGTFNGADSIFYNGALSRVTTNVNAGKAYIYGTSFNLTAGLSELFSIQSSLNYTYGRIITDTGLIPLDHIPPLFGRTGLNFNYKKFRGEFYILYNGWKYRRDYNIIGEDNFANATVSGMPSWFTLNIKGSYAVTDFLQVQGGIENILDRNYRVFGSNISAPGRNFMVALRGRF